jgi:hypothetical protein
MTETQTFDLTEPSGRYVADKRGPRIALMIGVFVLIACVLGVSLKVALQVDSGYTLSSNQVYLFTSFVVLFGLLALYLIWLRVGIAPGAVCVVLSDQGIELAGPGARLDRLQWTDPHTAFELQNHSSDRFLAETKLPYFLVMKRGRTTALTQEAYDAILANCEARGLVLPDLPNRVRTLFPSGAPLEVHRVRGRPSQ